MMQADMADQKFAGLKYHKVGNGKVHYLVNELVPVMQSDEQILAQLFEPSFIKEHALHWTAKGGRGQTLLFELESKYLFQKIDSVAQECSNLGGPTIIAPSSMHLCYRQYLRGGLIGKVIKRSFLSCSAQAHRAVDEFKMLLKMRLLGLPVPRPLVACERSVFLTVQNEIIIEEIQGTQNLAEILRERPLSDMELDSIGTTLYHFFKFNVHHTDLNLRNILLDSSGNCYVIDFDKCKFESNPYQSVIIVNNMFKRLERSFNKAQRLGHIKHYKEGMVRTISKTTMGLLAIFFEDTEEHLRVDLANRPEEALANLCLNEVAAVLQST